MQTIACLSLSGGQGKTTTAILLSKRLAAAGRTVLVIDADPQNNLTTFLGHDVAANAPTLLEVFRGSVALEEAIYPTASENLFLVPADDGLDTVQDYLASSGVGAMLLRKRLVPANGSFDLCLIDCPPQRSQICKSAIGASDRVLIPCEATVKGYSSLVRTLDAIAELREIGASQAELLGVLPFRDRWVGANQSQESRTCIEEMRREVGPELVLPSIRESERYKQAIAKGITLSDLGFPDLEYPFEVLIQQLTDH